MPRRRLSVVSAALALLAVAPAAHGTVSAQALDAALTEAQARAGAPGVSAAVIERGTVAWTGVSGSTVLGGLPVTPATPFITASTGKTVTAAMVLRLVDEGRLGLRQRVSGLIRLRGGRSIRVRELLEHSSGLPDYLDRRKIFRTIAAEPQHPWTRREVLRVVGRPQFIPGSRVSYSNSNYVALGGIVEAVEGAPVEAAFERLLEAPLGLTGSTWRYDGSLVSRIAHPYVERGGTLVDRWAAGSIPTDFLGEVWTDGGLATTASDLGRVANELIAGSLLRSSSRRAMLDFREQGTGLGVFAERFAGSRWIGHDGLYEGFSSQHWTNRRRGLTIVVLTNLETAPSRQDASVVILQALARAALSD